MVEYSDNVGLAFAVCICAGLSTAIGGSVVFFPSLIQFANRKTLASGLGLSAGVMTYVSFVEILQKSVISFTNADFLDNQAYLAATLCFFAGIMIMICLNFLVHAVTALAAHGKVEEDEEDEEDESSVDEDHDDESVPSKHNHSNNKAAGPKKKKHDEDSLLDTQGHCCSAGNPVERLENIQEMAKRTAEIKEQEELEDSETWMDEMENAKVPQQPSHAHSATLTTVEDSEETTDDLEKGTEKANKVESRSTASTASKSSHSKKGKKPSKKDQRRLAMMSLNTAIAIGLHNFPEGLATFVATLEDPKVGALLAIAIAIHNIPEGLCVAMPVYYATGNRWKAFSWALLSGVCEPIAALFGWLVLATAMNDIVYAILFGVVAGMMTIISVKELLPTAHRYDPEDSLVSNMFITGMAVMAVSLVLFKQL